MGFLGFTKDNKQFNLDLNSLVTHGIVVSSSGGGKTGLLIDLVEEATISGINSIVLDTKGDLCNLLLPFHSLSENITASGKESYKGLSFWVEEGKHAIEENPNWINAQTKDNVIESQYINSAEFKVIAPSSILESLPSIESLFSLTPESKPKVTVLYLRHFSDEHREIMITQLLELVKDWLKTSKASSLLKNLLVIDEAANILPPAPKNPLTKIPLATIIAQARSQGLGVLLATQNPNDIDYKALSNVGTWFLGGLRKRDTQRDLKVIIEDKELDSSEIYNLPPRHFMALTKDGKATSFRSRCTMSYLAGPLSLEQVEKLNSIHSKEKVLSGIVLVAFNIDNTPKAGYIASLEFKQENGTWDICKNVNGDCFFTVNKGNNTFSWDTSKQVPFKGEVDVRLNIINKYYVPVLNKIKVNSLGIV